MKASCAGHANIVDKLLTAGGLPNHQDNVRNLMAMVVLTLDL